MTYKTIVLHNTLEAIELTFGDDTATITLQGAQVISYQQGGKERLWLSPKAHFEPGKPIRGGIPICWPWFGNHSSDPSKPAHGFVRVNDWILEEVIDTKESVSAVFRYDNPADCELYPHACSAKLIITLTDRLTVTLQTTNHDTRPISITQALHTYLPVSDLEHANIKGLEGTDYADKLKQFEQAQERRVHVNVSEPTDRVYFDSSPELTLVDQNLTTIVGKQNSNTTIIWNPGRDTADTMADISADHYRGFICIEAANALSDEVRVEPNTSYELVQTLNFTDRS